MKGSFKLRETATQRDFRGVLIFGKLILTAYPDCLTIYVRISQLLNEPSFKSKFMILTEELREMLP